MKNILREIKIYLHTLELRTFLLTEGFGFLFSLFCLIGRRLDQTGTIKGTLKGYMALLGMSIAGSLFICALCLCIFYLLDQTKGRGKKEKTEKPKGKKWIILYSGIFFLCYMPVFLAYYPSVFAYDVEGQLYQVIAGDYNTHHPLLHTLFLGIFLKIGCGVADMNLGFALHSLTQIGIMSSIFGYSLYQLEKRNSFACAKIAYLLWLIFLPLHGILLMSTTKDVLFAGWMLLFVMLQQAIWKEPTNKCVQFGLVIVTVLMLLFRNNALYAFIVYLLFSVLIVGKERRRKICLSFLLALLLSIGLSGGLKMVTDAYNGSPREMLSIPIQQLARVRVEQYDNMTIEEKERMEQVISSDWYYAYDESLADPIKSRISLDDPGNFVKTYLYFLKKYPLDYIDAFLFTTKGQWDLQDTSYAQIYGVGKETGFGYLSTEFRTMPEGFQVVSDSKLPEMRDFMEGIVSDNAYLNWPVLRLFFHPAFYTWLTVGMFFYAWIKKSRKGLYLTGFLVCYLLTLMLSPAVLVRYSYGVILSAVYLLISEMKGSD